MNILVAQSAGFCWGVRQAMDTVLEASARWGGQGPVRTIGPIIHNPQALEQVALRGVGQCDSAQEADNGTVIIRAHGIPVHELRDLQEKHRRRELRLLNGTCPEVAKVQARIKRYASRGYFTVLLGTHGHAEAVAHESYATSGCALVASLQEAQALRLDPARKTLVVAQTTFLVSEFEAIAAHLRDKVPDCVVLDTICKDTWMRQNEARALCQRVDHVVVIGGKASNNTRHLVDLARETGRSAQHIETVLDLDFELISAATSVGVLAGASTPNWLVDEVVHALETSRQQGPLARMLRFAQLTSLPKAAGVGLLALGVQTWMGLSSTWAFPLLAAICLWGVGALRAYGNIPAPAQEQRLRGILGRVPAAQDLLEALGITTVTIALPLLLTGRTWDRRAVVAAFLVLTASLTQAGVQGILDLQKNRIVGREVLATALGKSGTKALLSLLAVSAIGGFAWALARHPLRGQEWLQVLVAALVVSFPLVHLWWVHERFRAGRARERGSLEFASWFAGLLAFL